MCGREHCAPSSLPPSSIRSGTLNKHIRIILLTAFALALIYGGWMPMNFETGDTASEFAAALLDWQITPHNILTSGDVQLNILLFVPIGLLTAWIWGINIFSLLAAAGISAAVSLSIEAGQLFLPDRFCCVRDLVTNLSGGLLGWSAGISFFARPMRSRWRLAAGTIGRKYGFLAAAAIAMAMLARSAWSIRLSGCVLKSNLRAILESPMGDPARFTGLKWLTMGILPYMAITLLLASRRRERELSDGRIFAAGLCSLSVLTLCETMQLLNPAETTGLAALLLGWLGVAAAIPLAPVLHRRRVELPEMVLAAEICLALLLIRVAWSASGGGTALPLWGLYQHEFAWGYFAMARRLAFMSLIGFMGAFYLSLKYPWSLRRRTLVAAIAAASAAIVIELAKYLTGGSVNTAGLLEHAAAAIFGTLLFAMTWGYMDRRSGRKSDKTTASSYAGPNRRSQA